MPAASASDPATIPGDDATGACLDATPGAVPDCSTVPAGANGCAPVPTPKQRCSGYRAYFDPRVAASAVTCLSSLTPAQLCDPKPARDCGEIALAEACIDTAVNQLCQIAATPCKTSEAECAALISGLNDQGQQAVAQCVARGCGNGLDSCLDALTAGR